MQQSGDQKTVFGFRIDLDATHMKNLINGEISFAKVSGIVKLTSTCLCVVI